MQIDTQMTQTDNAKTDKTILSHNTTNPKKKHYKITINYNGHNDDKQHFTANKDKERLNFNFKLKIN